MKNEKFLKLWALRVYFLCIVLIAAFSCKHKMPAPPATESMESENQYTAAYQIIHQDLFDIINSEMTSRKDPLLIPDSAPPSENLKKAASSDGKYSLYINDKNQVFAHKEPGDPAQDKVVYEETGQGFHVELRLSSSNRYFFITSSNGNTSETRFLPADLSSYKPFLIQARDTGFTYQIEHFGSDIFWIITNKNASNRKLMQAMVSHPEEKYWLPVVPNRDSIYLEDFTLLDEKYIFLLEKYRPGVGIRIYNRDKNDEGAIRFKEPEGNLKLMHFDPENEKILLKYNSLLSPLTFYEFNLKTGRLSAQKKAGIKKFVKQDYSSEILWANASDGAKIPITLLYKTGLGNVDGSNPLLLSVDLVEPSTNTVRFNTVYLSLLDRGFYIAQACVRQGNAADDYLQCAEFLIQEKLCSPGLITGIGSGESNTIMQNVLNRHPEIFKAVIMHHVCPESNMPLLPDQSLKKQVYPAILVTASADNDKQCVYALKLVSDLRACNTGDQMILLKISNPSEPAERSAFLGTFLLDQYKINK